MQYEAVCKELNRPYGDGETQPFDGGEFLNYLELTGALKDARRYQARIGELLGKLERAGHLIHLGHGRDIFLGRKYYFLKEVTTLERKGALWLSNALGPRFLLSQYESSVAQITGTTADGECHAGTGIVVGPNWLLTCAHVLNDMQVDSKQRIAGQEYDVVDQRVHRTVDVGLVRVEPAMPVNPALAFRDPELAESLYTLGYPRVPLARTAPLVMQSGEVTSPEVTLFDGADVFLYSAIARPGNSGGPIIAATGHVLGIVTEELSEESRRFSAPFHAGVRSTTLAAAVAELESGIVLPIEDYE